MTDGGNRPCNPSLPRPASLFTSWQTTQQQKQQEELAITAGIANKIPERDRTLKTTFSQRQTCLNPSEIRAISQNLRPGGPFLRRHKINDLRRRSPPQTLGQKRELRAEIQKVGNIPDGGPVHKKFKSASLNQQSALCNQAYGGSLFQPAVVNNNSAANTYSTNQWLLTNEIKSQFSASKQPGVFPQPISLANPITNLPWQQKHHNRQQECNAAASLFNTDGVKSLFPFGMDPRQQMLLLQPPVPKFTTTLRQQSVQQQHNQPFKAAAAGLSLFVKAPQNMELLQPDLANLHVASPQIQPYELKKVKQRKQPDPSPDADGPNESDKVQEQFSLFPINRKKRQDPSSEANDGDDDDENDVDFLVDDIDQFLSEIVHQRWSVTQVACFKPVQKQQTMFSESRVQPLSLPELDRWAIKLRSKVRKFVKSKALRRTALTKHDREDVEMVNSSADQDDEVDEVTEDLKTMQQKRKRPPLREALIESEESQAEAASEKACSPSYASLEKTPASSSKEIFFTRLITGYVSQANKQTQVTKKEIIEEKGDRKYVCQTCGEVFAHGQALGGHMSRTHPGSSSAYNNKVLRRSQREVDRELLRLAKIMHAEEFGQDAPIDRVKIRSYKKELRKQVNRGQLVLKLESQNMQMM